ncbi:hypothetical protein WCLP8_230001 [uncultured Gammaproteobacteria bacterium]
MDQEPIGTGPYQFVGRQREVRINYRPFAGYWGGRGPLESLVFAVVPDSAQRLAKLGTGECQVMARPTVEQQATLSRQAAEHLIFSRQPRLDLAFLAFNTTRKPFGDKRVRLAVATALDRAALVARMSGEGVEMEALAPFPAALTPNDDQPGAGLITPDVERARKLLAEAGQGGGFEVELLVMPMARPVLPAPLRAGMLVAEELERLGLKVTVVNPNLDDTRRRLREGAYGLLLAVWTADAADAGRFLTGLAGCEGAGRPLETNWSRWCPPAYVEILNRVNRSADTVTRNQALAQARSLFRDELPWLPLAHSISITPLRSEVGGFQLSPLGLHHFEGVDMVR